MSRGELRSRCPDCQGELVKTRSGAVCMNAAVGKCDRSRVLKYAVVVHPNQHTYEREFPAACYTIERRCWVCNYREFKRDTKRRVVDAYCDGDATIARTERGKLIVLVPLKEKSKCKSPRSKKTPTTRGRSTRSTSAR